MGAAVIIRNKRLIITKNYVVLDERIVSLLVVIIVPRAPRIHSADRKKNYAQTRIVCPTSSACCPARAVCISHVVSPQLQSLRIFSTLPSFSRVTGSREHDVRDLSLSPSISLPLMRRGKFYFADGTPALLETESEEDSLFNAAMTTKSFEMVGNHLAYVASSLHVLETLIVLRINFLDSKWYCTRFLFIPVQSDFVLLQS